jgi:WD40 repeat protein
MLRARWVTLMAAAIGIASASPAAARAPQDLPQVWLDGFPDVRIAVSALHGPIRLSTLTGVDERAVIVGNVNAQDWSPTGDRLVYVDDRGGGEYALSITDTLGSTRQLPVPMRSTWPQYSPDGRWIYFFTQDDRSRRVYRIAPDGTNLQDLFPGSFPSPAPDGTIAITTGEGVWVGDPVSGIGTVVPNTTAGAFATRWSPDGAWIAYRDRDGGITLIRPDGTAKRSIPAPPIGGLSWSPDGNWLLGGNVDGEPLQLIDLRTDAARFLPVHGVYPAWRPSPQGLVAVAWPSNAPVPRIHPIGITLARSGPS